MEMKMRKNMQPNTLTRRGYKGWIYINNISKKKTTKDPKQDSHRIPIEIRKQSGKSDPDPDIKKIYRFHNTTVADPEQDWIRIQLGY